MLQWGRDVTVADRPPVRVRDRRGVQASMGPRRYRRGSDNQPYILASGMSELQWGRDVTVADRFNVLYAKLSNKQLQWGRDVTVADRSSSERIMNDGKTASMGPRRYRRGSPCASAAAPARLMLQWGRDVTVADRPSFRRDGRIRTRRLQWGRDVTVADRRTCQSMRSGRSSFNGAATLPSRIEVVLAVDSDAKAVGFNGAATLPSRIVRLPREVMTGGRSCFNGAATLPSRIVRSAPGR